MRAPPQGGAHPRFAASFFPRPTREYVRKKSLAETNPELAAEMHSDSDIKATEVTAGSNKKPLWMCERGHTWRTAVNRRIRKANCPYCSGAKVLKGFNDLATIDPQLASQVAPESPIKADEITAGSSKELRWTCKLGHIWSARTRDRRQGRNCPYCTNQKVLAGFNDLATINPSLAAKVSPSSELKATEVTSGSTKKLLWRCARGHEWLSSPKQRKSRGCSQCQRENPTIFSKSLAETHPDLAKEVSPHSKLKSTEVTAGSNTKLLWRCTLGHEWEASPCSRRHGNNCPYCAGKKVLPGFNDLATTNPELTREVSPSSSIKATEVTAGSHKKLLWKCVNNHQWTAMVATRNRGIGCPCCAERKVVIGVNDLATVSPELAKEVSPNSKLKPNEVTAGSDKKILWVCSLGHEWEVSPSARIRGNGCPYCSGWKVMQGFNDLATVSPGLAAQVSPNSKIKPTEVTVKSKKKLLWICPEKHEWLSRTANRSNGSTCPLCNSSQAERNLAELIESLIPRNTKILRNDRKVIKPYELDILIPSLNLAFEFNGTYWHSDEVITKRHPQFESSKSFDDFKKTECANQGIKLFFVREKPWTESHEKEVKRVEKIVAAALKEVA